jgi:hypothetical protein
MYPLLPGEGERALYQGTTLQAAGKRLKRVNSLIWQTKIQRVTNEILGQKGQLLLPWFFFPQPVKSCPDTTPARGADMPTVEPR